jgi:hypothetical protein
MSATHRTESQIKADRVVLAVECRDGRNAGEQDARSGEYRPETNPFLPARTPWERELALAWADGYATEFVAERERMMA